MSKPVQFRYPPLGDPKPRPNQRVMLIRADNKHEPGTWSDDCKAWAELHAETRKKAKSNPQPTKETA